MICIPIIKKFNVFLHINFEKETKSLGEVDNIDKSIIYRLKAGNETLIEDLTYISSIIKEESNKDADIYERIKINYDYLEKDIDFINGIFEEINLLSVPSKLIPNYKTIPIKETLDKLTSTSVEPKTYKEYYKYLDELYEKYGKIIGWIIDINVYFVKLGDIDFELIDINSKISDILKKKPNFDTKYETKNTQKINDKNIIKGIKDLIEMLNDQNESYDELNKINLKNKNKKYIYDTDRGEIFKKIINKINKINEINEIKSNNVVLSIKGLLNKMLDSISICKSIENIYFNKSKTNSFTINNIIKNKDEFITNFKYFKKNINKQGVEFNELLEKQKIKFDIELKSISNKTTESREGRDISVIKNEISNYEKKFNDTNTDINNLNDKLTHYNALNSKKNSDEMSINNFEETEKQIVKSIVGKKKIDYNDKIIEIINKFTGQISTKKIQKDEYDKKLNELKAELSRTNNIIRETSIKTIKENRLKELISDIDRQISKPLLSNNTVKITKIKDTFLQEYTYLENISKEMLDSINSSNYKGTNNKIMTIFDSDTKLKAILDGILLSNTHSGGYKLLQKGGAKHGISGIAASIASTISLRAPPAPPAPPAHPAPPVPVPAPVHIPQKVNMLSSSSAILASIASNNLMIRSDVGAKAAVRTTATSSAATSSASSSALSAAAVTADAIIDYFKDMSKNKSKNKTFFKIFKNKYDSFKLEKDKDIEAFFEQLLKYEDDIIKIISNLSKNKLKNKISNNDNDKLKKSIIEYNTKIKTYNKITSEQKLPYTEVIPYTDTIYLYFLLLFYSIKII